MSFFFKQLSGTKPLLYFCFVTTYISIGDLDRTIGGWLTDEIKHTVLNLGGASTSKAMFIASGLLKFASSCEFDAHPLLIGLMYKKHFNVPAEGITRSFHGASTFCAVVRVR